MIVPWAAGGATDQTCRILAGEMEKVLGQKIPVINQPGGSGSIGMKNAFEAKHDGYTWAGNADGSVITYQVLDLLPNISHRDWIHYYAMLTAPVICVPGDSKIKTIYEGMDLSLYPKNAYRKEFHPGTPTVVGTVAHLSPEKGIHYLIEAASLIPDVHRKLQFIVVGEGSCLSEIKALTQKKGLDNVFQFVGFHSNTAPFMKTFDIFTLPSLSEGLSSAILEAMATSLPVVATEVGGIPELVKNGDNGLLVTPADPQSLSHAIQHLVNNPDESRRMGLRGRKRMEEQFTLKRKIAETEQLCRILLKRPESSPRSAYA